MPRKPLIAIDIDGTLLDEGYALPSSTASYLKRVNEKACIVLSSGRPYRAMESIYEALSCTGPLICYNGAHVFVPNDPSFVPKKASFSLKEVEALLKELSPYLEGYQVEDEQTIYRKGIGNELRDFFPEEGMKVISGASGFPASFSPYALVFKEKRRNDDAFLSAVSKYKGLEWRHWSECPFSELHIPSVSKGNALSYVMEQLGASGQDCFAFGDSDNDFEMLSLVGHPFAMANSKSKALLNAFPRTEKGNSDEGVAFELRKYF